MINMERVQWLLEDSDVTGYQISKQSGVSQTLIGKYRSDDYDLENMTIKTAKQLTKTANAIWNSKISDAADFVKNNYYMDGNLSMVEVMPVDEFKKTLVSDLNDIQHDKVDEQFTTFDEYDIHELLQSGFESGYVFFVMTAPHDGATSYAVDFNFENVAELSSMSQLNSKDRRFFNDILSILPQM